MKNHIFINVKLYNFFLKYTWDFCTYWVFTHFSLERLAADSIEFNVLKKALI